MLPLPFKACCKFWNKFRTKIDDLKKVRKDDKECYFRYYPNYAIYSTCAHMLNNGCDMDDEDMSQNEIWLFYRNLNWKISFNSIDI